MSEEEQTIEVEVNPMDTFINDVMDKNFVGAQDAFNSMIGDKLQDALDAEKIRMADQVFNGEEPEQLEMDFDDDEDIGDEETTITVTAEDDTEDEIVGVPV